MSIDELEEVWWNNMKVYALDVLHENSFTSQTLYNFITSSILITNRFTNKDYQIILRSGTKIHIECLCIYDYLLLIVIEQKEELLDWDENWVKKTNFIAFMGKMNVKLFYFWPITKWLECSCLLNKFYEKNSKFSALHVIQQS